MQPRIQNPALTVPDALEALQKLGNAVEQTGVPAATLHLIEMRASQINGCSVCLDMHSRELKAIGEPDERLFMVSAWREAPYFSQAERAALALTEGVTRLADRPDPIPDERVGGRRPSLQRGPAGRVGHRDRNNQRLQPGQRRHQADHRQLGGPMGREQTPGVAGRVTMLQPSMA